MSRVYAVISPGKITDTSAVRKPKMANAVANGIDIGVIGVNWTTIQTTSGGAVAVSGIQDTLDDALNVGMKVVLQINLQYPPSFVTSGVEQFKDQNAVLWTDSDGTGAAGDRVRNWQWTAQGRTYVADLFTKLGASGIASHSALMGARLGGGYSGEAHYAPITTSPMQWWIYGTSLQTGTGLASDQVVCPHPGRTPLFNGTNDAFDHDIANWWLNGMSVWINWLITQHKSAGFGSTNFQNLWVLHPSTGVRDRPHSDSAWIQEVARGVDPRRLLSAYAHDNKVWPWSTWNDNTGTSTSETGMGSCVKLLQEAKAYGKLARFASENSHTNSDINGCFTVSNGLSSDNSTGASGWLFNWLNYDSLVGGVAGDVTMSQYATKITTQITTDLLVDFTTTTHPLDAYSVGATISTFNGNGGVANINLSTTWKSDLQALGPLAWRIPLRYNAGNPGSSANFAQSSGDAGTYIANIKAIGGVPVIVVGGDTADNNFTASDAANLVHYFNDGGGQHGGPVSQWIIGNEYTNPSNDPNGYQANLASYCTAMLAADATIKLSAPATPDMAFSTTQMANTVTNASAYVSYLSYHAYQGESKGLANTADYETYPNTFRSTYITAGNFGGRVGLVQPSLEEFNWDPGYTAGVTTEFYTWHNTVFFASVIGHSLSAGARAFMYSDSAGPLGLMNDGSGANGQVGSFRTKFPSYWGLGMWTGLNGTFRRFGSNMVVASSSMTNVEVFATDNGKIIVVNKDGSNPYTVTLGFRGQPSSGTYSVWQTASAAPTTAPTKVTNAANYSASVISITLPAGTVSSIELN